MRASSAAEPGIGSIRNTGLSLMCVRHLVEVRSGSQQVAGIWCDVWVSDGASHCRAEFANQAADHLRAQGFTVRVRPVLG
jgi:hypothetical protein